MYTRAQDMDENRTYQWLRNLFLYARSESQKRGDGSAAVIANGLRTNGYGRDLRNVAAMPHIRAISLLEPESRPAEQLDPAIVVARSAHVVPP